jgi:ribose 5-phosphate isomerase RpiB
VTGVKSYADASQQLRQSGSGDYSFERGHRHRQRNGQFQQPTNQPANRIVNAAAAGQGETLCGTGLGLSAGAR